MRLAFLVLVVMPACTDAATTIANRCGQTNPPIDPSAPGLVVCARFSDFINSHGDVLFLGLLGACGGTVADVGDAGSEAAAPDATASGPGQPPTPPQDNTTPPTANIYTFAMHDFFFGDAPRDGSPPSPTAWQAFGYNLDGKVTSASSTDVCSLYSGAPTTNQTDGLDGIDNAWGAVAVPELQLSSGVTELSKALSTTLQKGNSTMQFQVVGLSDDPQQSSTGLRAQIFLSGAYDSGVPAFDDSTDWPVLSSSLIDGQTIAGGAKSAFPDAYVSGGTFVSGKATDIVEVDVFFQGVNLPLMLRDAFFTFVHVDHGDAIQGTIAGIIDVQQFCDEVTMIGGRISLSLCTGPELEALLDHFRKASDIGDDGSNVQGQPCTGISVGLGFNAKLVANPTKVTQAPLPPPDPCAD